MTGRSWAAVIALLLTLAGVAGCGRDDNALHCADVTTPPIGTVTDLSQWVTTEQTELRKDGPSGEVLAQLAAGSPLVNLLEERDGWVKAGCWKSEQRADDNAITGYVNETAVKATE